MKPETWLKDLPAWKNVPMANALHSILELHEPVNRRGVSGRTWKECQGCGVPFPCYNRKAITAALGLKEER